jgi:hypothetical protein
MDTIVITTCSNRKRVKPSNFLRARSLPVGDLQSISKEWNDRISNAPDRQVPADLYCGRGFREAENAAKKLKTKPLVISAGLGLLSSDCEIPAYDLTLSPYSLDSVFTRIAEKITPSEWWEAIALAQKKKHPISSLVATKPKSLVLIACSGNYTNLISNDLMNLKETDLSRVRLFGPKKLKGIPEAIRPLIMPYDERFDGPSSPLPGTRGDFAQRVMCHFAEHVARPPKDLHKPERHAELIEEILNGWKYPRQVTRIKKTDDEIIDLVANLWPRAQGSSGRMLRVLRDQEMIACEQGRFASLFKIAKERYSL